MSAVTAVSALQQISGSQTSDIGYTIDVDSAEGDGYSSTSTTDVTMGTVVAVLAEFLHIPNLLRHGYNHQSRLLPSTDFLSQIEEGLLNACSIIRTLLPFPSMKREAKRRRWSRR